jgi:hypothetical protein
MERKNAAKVEPVDMKLEVVVLGVSGVDRAKAFDENLGWRLDAAMTPFEWPHSASTSSAR